MFLRSDIRPNIPEVRRTIAPNTLRIFGDIRRSHFLRTTRWCDTRVRSLPVSLVTYLYFCSLIFLLLFKEKTEKDWGLFFCCCCHIGLFDMEGLSEVSDSRAFYMSDDENSGSDGKNYKQFSQDQSTWYSAVFYIPAEYFISLPELVHPEPENCHNPHRILGALVLCFKVHEK